MSASPIRNQFADTMLKVGAADPNLVVLVSDISHFLLQPFAVACPGRYYNMGICEPASLSVASGLSKIGFHPVVHTISPFIIERSFEQLKLDFCYQELGGNLVTVGSAFDYGNLGCTHHCTGDFAMMKTLPRTQIVYPSSPLEFDTLFRQVYRSGFLTLYRLPARDHGLSFSRSEIQFGKGIRVTEGRDLTLVVTGPQLKNAMILRERLAQEGVEVEILYVHTLRPLDAALIRQSVEKTRRVFVIEEHVRTGGLGEDVLFATRDIPGAGYSFAFLPDRFIREYGSYEEHCERMGFTPEGFLRRVKTDFTFSRGEKVRVS